MSECNLSDFDGFCYVHKAYCERERLVQQALNMDQLYAELPTIECQGLCEDSCGPIEMSPVEHDRIQANFGVDLPDHRTMLLQLLTSPIKAAYRCPALVNGRCSVYAMRPMICRLWGVTELLPCPYGCRASRMLGYEDSMVMVAAGMWHGGTPDAVPPSEMRRLMADNPELVAMTQDFMRPWSTKGVGR